jgi:hypothetical protein
MCLAFLQLCHAVQHNSAIQASVGTKNRNNGHKSKTVRRSRQWYSDTQSESPAEASDIEDELEEEVDNNNHKL